VDAFTTQWSTPVGYQRFRLLWPAGRFLEIRNLGVNVPPTVKQNGEVKEYLWEFRNFPIVTEEDSLPSWYDPYPSVQLSEFASWKEVAEWAARLYPRPPQLAPELVEKINTWQHSLVQPEARLASVLQFIQDEIRYLGIEFGPNSHQPSDPSVVFARRFGDCKDKAYLFCTILQQLNIDAAVALVHTEYCVTIADWLPSPYAFDHVVVQVRLNGKTYWLDPTKSHQGGPVGDRYFPDYGRCLLIRPETTELTVIPQQKSGWPITTVQETFMVHGRKEPAEMTVHTRAEGLDADRLRAAFADVGRNELEKRYLNFYARDYPKIKTTKPLEVLDHSEQNVFETFEHYQIQEFWTLSDDHRKYKCEFYPRIVLDLLDEPTTTLRSMPLAIGYPQHEILQTEVILPEPWPVTGNTNHVSTPAAQLTTRRTTQTNMFWLKYEYQSLTNCVLVTNVPAYLKNLNQMKDLLGYSLTWANEELPASAGTPHLSWTIVSLAGIYMILLTAGCAILYRVRRLPFPIGYGEEPPALDQRHVGLGGWLVLPAFGLFARPIQVLFAIGGNWSAYSTESWHSLTDPSGGAYHGLWAPLLIFELLVNLTLMGFPVLLIILFFQRRKTFPPLFVLFLLFALITTTFDEFGSRVIPAVAKQNSSVVSRELIQSYMACAIWIPYMLVSKRVKATFVR
jgi:transglutaminase-like putative cysteine protease